MSSPPQRLGKNINGYFGERIDIAAVLAECLTLARNHGWTIEELGFSGNANLLALTRPAVAGPKLVTHVYLSAGIHGDEPAGPLAILQLLRQNRWPPEFALWLIPCLNPIGFAMHRRENADGRDLNREYHEPTARETRTHIAWLRRQPSFDLTFCLHEDWESHGFYLYELNPDNQPSAAERMIERVANLCPIDQSELIEGRPARGGIIRPSADPRSRPQWPEAFYLLTHHTRLSYTLEAPSDFPLSNRVSALVAAVEAALEFKVALHFGRADPQKPNPEQSSTRHS
jgi:protein MpaA